MLLFVLLDDLFTDNIVLSRRKCRMLFVVCAGLSM